MFPLHPFTEVERDWRGASDFYGWVLRSVNEPSLLIHAQISKDRIYRFTLFQTLYAKIVIMRLRVASDGRGLLSLKLATSGRLPRVYKEESKLLSKEQVVDLTSEFMMSNYLDLVPYMPMHGLDGEGWLLEASVDGYYHFTLRQSPQEKEIRDIGGKFMAFYLDEIRKDPPNQALVPTPASVTPAADAPVAPDAGAAHL